MIGDIITFIIGILLLLGMLAISLDFLFGLNKIWKKFTK